MRTAKATEMSYTYDRGDRPSAEDKPGTRDEEYRRGQPDNASTYDEPKKGQGDDKT
jgi:hypothetical protein